MDFESLRASILDLQKRSRNLEPNAAERSTLNKQVENYADHFLNEIEMLKAFEVNKEDAEIIWASPITETPTDIGELLQLLSQSVDNTGLNPASGGHLGYIPGGGIYTSALGDYLAAVTNRYAGIHFASPGAVNMERLLIQWLCEIFQFGPESGGTLCSGGSIANLTAIVAARDAKGIKSSQVPKAVVYMTDQTHHCVHKALRIAGLEECIIRNISRDELDQMNTIELEKQIQKDQAEGWIPWMVVASAGSTDTGAVDPMQAISAICKKHNLWMHIDAAYGGFFKLCPALSNLFNGIEEADSLVIDPHKGLFMPYGIGAVIVKKETHLLHSHFYLANYMQDAYQSQAQYSPADLSPELTRHFRALRMWLPLKLHGLQPFRHALEEKLLLAQYAAKRLRSMNDIELRMPPQLSVVCFRITQGDNFNATNQAFIDYIQKDGEVFLSSTRIDNNLYIRMAILSFRTHLSTIDKAIEKLESFLTIT